MPDDDRQMCLGCSVNPATSSDGTVPLCAKCKSLTSNPRGVEFQKSAETPETPEPQNQTP